MGFTAAGKAAQRHHSNLCLPFLASLLLSVFLPERLSQTIKDCA